jgi:beta-galactosidase
MNKFPVSRRRFLRQTSLGMAGLALTSAGLGVVAAVDSGTNQFHLATAEGNAVSKANEPFKPIRYRLIAAKVIGLKQNTVSLDGRWRIDPRPGPDVREQPLNAANWSDFCVPGQWAQQGYEIPLDETAALAREFTIPAKWVGYRIFLRFDAIHGGTHYWLNGKLLGYSENLFTPVEWEITDFAKVGQPNRLDLEMKVATASERLSSSSGYTGYSLGGIDRAVRIYALPRFHISNLRLDAGLDKTYQDGELQVTLGLDNPEQGAVNGLAVVVQLFDARGKRVKHSNPKVMFDSLQPGPNTANLESQVPNPLKWNAEQPNLYKLVLVLEKDGKALERIERTIGFRTVETRDRQLYINGVRVKLAGVCHHEIDPLTGRADTMRHAEEDVKLFKSANLNYVRTSHYPPTQEFLDAADRYGLYVESEAPLCWVAPAKDMTDLKAILTPTSAMIDYNHPHPSVIIWSLANESHWSGLFDESDKLCKQLDPTRPTTIEHAFSNEDKVTCDIISRHYQKMPYDEILKDDPRPFLHGECFFLVYHERTDVAINPGLRELWAAGSANPASEWGKSCIENVEAAGRGLLPGIYPGAWSYIYASHHCIGSEIWSGVDDIAYLKNGEIVSSEHSNAYWGLIDGWRRPKPELELARFVFSPVWFPVRKLDYQPGRIAVRVPVENRYSFTGLCQFDFLWEMNGARGKVRVNVPPASNGEIEIPIPIGTPEGSTLLVRVMNGSNEIVNATLALGETKKTLLPQSQAGPPKWNDDGRLITIEGVRFSLVLDRASGDFDATNPRHKAPIVTFPSLHVTRHDFGDLDRKKPPYAEFPDAKTRVVESITAVETGNGLELTVKDHYDHFAGVVRWLIDQYGAGKISYDYTYSGDNLDSREVGIKAMLPAKHDEVKWRCWSEWGIFPKDSICRTEGTAKAHRDKKWPDQPVNTQPAWPWSQDQTELGTADFRSIKFCIYEAELVAPDGSGMQVDANADAHFRTCLAQQCVKIHILSQCPLAPMVLKNGARLTGDFAVRFVSGSTL